MRVTCNANMAKALTTKYLVGNTPESLCHVTLGRGKIVFSIAVYWEAIMLLFSDDSNLTSIRWTCSRSLMRGCRQTGCAQHMPEPEIIFSPSWATSDSYLISLIMTVS